MTRCQYTRLPITELADAFVATRGQEKMIVHFQVRDVLVRQGYKVVPAAVHLRNLLRQTKRHQSARQPLKRAA